MPHTPDDLWTWSDAALALSPDEVREAEAALAGPAPARARPYRCR